MLEHGIWGTLNLCSWTIVIQKGSRMINLFPLKFLYNILLQKKNFIIKTLCGEEDLGQSQRRRARDGHLIPG